MPKLRPPSSPSKSSRKLPTSGEESQEKGLRAIFRTFDFLGKTILGDLWQTFYLSVQDAIALALILHIPGLIGQFILGKEFSGFDVCLSESPLSVSRYACFVIVSSDYLLWTLMAGRIGARFIRDFVTLIQGKS